MKNKDIKIGNLKLDNPFVAAPLAGITDAASRSIYKSMGAALVYTEMVSGKGLIYGSKNTKSLLEITGAERPVAFQIFGSEPEVVAQVAKELDRYDNDILDINMGCPVPKIVKNGEGSAILKDPDLAYELVRSMVKNSSKAITAKIRIGWDENSINGVEIAKALEAAGTDCIAVHGRTAKQYYSGDANWQLIAEIKKNVRIPVIGNGDVFEPEDALKMMEVTGCDMVMIGRGALGNPWIFRDCLALWNSDPRPDAPTLREKANMAEHHLRLMIKNKGERVAVNEMRKIAPRYFKGEAGATELRRRVNQINDSSELIQLIEDYVHVVYNVH